METRQISPSEMCDNCENKAIYYAEIFIQNIEEGEKEKINEKVLCERCRRNLDFNL